MKRSGGQCDVTVSLFFLAVLILLERPTPVFGYRPFVSTDAAVVDPHEIELELGYFNLEREKQKNTYTTPQIVLNYGLFPNWEVVGEFVVEKSPGTEARLVDPGLFLKSVLKDGVLQNEKGVSIAVEAGPLLPSTVKSQKGVGFEGLGIVSGRLARLTYHLNVGGGINRHQTDPFALWGVILEWSMTTRFRLVGEVNGESVRKTRADNSGLFGCIWQPWSPVSLDAGVRKNISHGSPDWRFTIGLTVQFSLPSFFTDAQDVATSGETP
jgi:hypothetical protein